MDTILNQEFVNLGSVKEILENPVFIYSFVVTTINVIRWTKKETTSSFQVLGTYVVSFASRYHVSRLYMLFDIFDYANLVMSYAEEKKFKLL